MLDERREIEHLPRNRCRGLIEALRGYMAKAKKLIRQARGSMLSLEALPDEARAAGYDLFYWWSRQDSNLRALGNGGRLPATILLPNCSVRSRMGRHQVTADARK
jgi:hypothetical protein